MTSIFTRWFTGGTTHEQTQQEQYEQEQFEQEQVEQQSPQREIHLGLSIDSDSDSHSKHHSVTSTLSDFEEGMPLWAKNTPSPQVYDNPDNERNRNADSPIGFQIHLPLPAPQALRSQSLETEESPASLTQRTPLKHNLSLPLIGTNNNETRTGSRQYYPSRKLQFGDFSRANSNGYSNTNGNSNSNSNNNSGTGGIRCMSPGLFKAILTVLVTFILGVTWIIQRQRLLVYTDAIAMDGSGDIHPTRQQQFPVFYSPNSQNQGQGDTPLEQPFVPPLVVLDETTNIISNAGGSRRRRSQLALARSPENLPVFGGFAEETMGSSSTQGSSASESWISLLGGFTFCVILIETGWKGYQQGYLQGYKRSRIRMEEERKL